MADLDTGTLAWAALNGLLDRALDLGPDERQRWLDRLPPEYDMLRPRLVRLLAGALTGNAGDSLATIPKFDDGAAVDTVRLESATIGPYRVVRKVADGGMGTVWQGHRTDLMVNRPVALKLPRGEWHAAKLAERIAAEREILAGLDHPNIARLYDAGVSADGQPYLALEYIDGRPIDEYIAAKSPPLRDRLQLLVRVARAVAHAHSRLVVHRDLKPSNILVTDDGDVKLLDFGIAALLDGARGVGSVEPHVFTPGYASPEQLSGELPGTATDVYSLGVVSFEVITGVRRFTGRRRLVGAEDAGCRPSDAAFDLSTRRALRGDLDAIVLKALHPRPAGRYGTMDALADDIERYLEHRPVEARGRDVWYRVVKGAVRHRMAVSAGAAVLVALLAGIGVAGWQAQLARNEQARAVEARDFLITLIQDANPFGPSGRPLSAADWLKQAKVRADAQLAQRPALGVHLLSVIGSSLANLQDADAAAAVLREAIETGTVRLGADHPATLQARVRMTVVDRYRGRTTEQRAALAQLLPRLRASGRPLAEDLSIALRSQAQLEIEEGRYEAAERAADEAIDVTARILGESHPEYVVSLMLRAYVCYFSCDPRAALSTAERAFRAVQTFYRDVPLHPRIIEGRYLFGRALAGAGDPEQGVHQLEQAVSEAAQVLGPSSRKVGVILFPLVQAQIDSGRVVEAAASGRTAVDIIAREAEPASIRLATALHAHGAALLAARRVTTAIPELERAVAIVQRRLPAGHETTRAMQADLGLALARAGRAREAVALLQELLPSRREEDPVRADSRVLLALSVAERFAEVPSKALRFGQLALQQMPSAPSADIPRMRALTEVGLACLDLGKPQDAIEPLEQALGVSRRLQSHASPDRADILVGLGRALLAVGRPAAARPLLAEADRFWRQFDAAAHAAHEPARGRAGRQAAPRSRPRRLARGRVRYCSRAEKTYSPRSPKVA
jgi:serine/threonine-protein kinase